MIIKILVVMMMAYGVGYTSSPGTKDLCIKDGKPAICLVDKSERPVPIVIKSLVYLETYIQNLENRIEVLEDYHD